MSNTKQIDFFGAFTDCNFAQCASEARDLGWDLLELPHGFGFSLLDREITVVFDRRKPRHPNPIASIVGAAEQARALSTFDPS